MVQQNPLDSPFGSVWTNAMTGLSGLGGASLQSANSGNDLLQLAALLGGSRGLTAAECDFSACSAPASTPAQQQATQAAAQQAEMQKRIEADATKRAAELVKIEHDKKKQKKKNMTRTRRNETRMILPHEDRRMDGHRVLRNAKLLQKPMLTSRRWEMSMTNSGRPSIFGGPFGYRRASV